MNTDEKVPVKTPKNITSANGRITGPPKISNEQERREHRGVRQHGARQRFVDRLVEHADQFLPPVLAQILTHAIEDDDRVIQ